MKRYFGIIVVVASLTLLTGCGKSNSTIETIDKNTETIKGLNDCKKWCELLINETVSKDDCYKLCETSKKLESNNISDCDDIEKTSGNFVTKDVCIQDKAIQAKNPEYCQVIENEINKDSCYMSLASDLNNKILCDSIRNDIIKATCMQEETEE